MTKLRITMDLILPDTPQVRAKLRSMWEDMKQFRNVFERIDPNEESFVQIQLCEHDTKPNDPCTTVRFIRLGNIEREDNL